MREASKEASKKNGLKAMRPKMAGHLSLKDIFPLIIKPKRPF
jgi:hypothetical protein